MPDQEEQGIDRAANPSLDEVLAVRDEQLAELERWLMRVTASACVISIYSLDEARSRASRPVIAFADDQR